ncbi:hypothetical protein [Steroidobacter agaridevorans]|uniref:hypothetical protein n=1 Tax=Steroidobacter agaridevorans TaxID=2695856 RepID=UPI001379E83D|nr:hypothetical protein [Steroidobacter agaridevorans]
MYEIYVLRRSDIEALMPAGAKRRIWKSPPIRAPSSRRISMRYSIAISVLALAAFTPLLLAQPEHSPQRYIIEVTSLVPDAERTVRGAIGYDSQLELIEVSTPFRKELNAVAITAMFVVAEPDGNIQVVVHDKGTAGLTKHGGASGRAIKIVEDPRDPLVTSSFGGF